MNKKLFIFFAMISSLWAEQIVAGRRAAQAQPTQNQGRRRRQQTVPTPTPTQPAPTRDSQPFVPTYTPQPRQPILPPQPTQPVVPPVAQPRPTAPAYTPPTTQPTIPAPQKAAEQKKSTGFFGWVKKHKKTASAAGLGALALAGYGGYKYATSGSIKTKAQFNQVAQDVIKKLEENDQGKLAKLIRQFKAQIMGHNTSDLKLSTSIEGIIEIKEQIQEAVNEAKVFFNSHPTLKKNIEHLMAPVSS